jgi:hypothetical protein
LRDDKAIPDEEDVGVDIEGEGFGVKVRPEGAG